MSEKSDRGRKEEWECGRVGADTLVSPFSLSPAQSGTVLAVCIAEKKSEKKKPVDRITLKKDWGVEGDAHAGTTIRQVSLLAQESVNPLIDKGLDVGPGDFAENLTVTGLDLKSLLLGARLKVGDAELLISQKGKECHTPCAIGRQVGTCIMPTQGVFARVVRSGEVKAGDAIEVIDDDDGSNSNNQ